MSALLTTTMPYMKVVIDALMEKGIRNDYVVLVGGAPLNEPSPTPSAPTPIAATRPSRSRPPRTSWPSARARRWRRRRKGRRRGFSGRRFDLRGLSGTEVIALLARRLAEGLAVAFREMRGGDEAAGQRHVEHRHVGLQQQQPRAVEAQLEVIARRRAVQVFAEQPLELTASRAPRRARARRGPAAPPDSPPSA